MKKIHWSEYKEPVFGALRAFDAKKDVSREWWRGDRDCELKFYKSARDFGAQLLAKNPSAQGAECRGSTLLGHPPLDARELIEDVLGQYPYPEHADCAQDACENAPFASVGGMDARKDMIRPHWISESDWPEYLRGYQAGAALCHGDGWEDGRFGWSPALTLGEEEAE